MCENSQVYVIVFKWVTVRVSVCVKMSKCMII